LIDKGFFVPIASSKRHRASIGAAPEQAAASFSQSYPQKMCMTGPLGDGAGDRILAWLMKS
jgi:hypothetical protein